MDMKGFWVRDKCRIIAVITYNRVRKLQRCPTLGMSASVAVKEIFPDEVPKLKSGHMALKMASLALA
jgi:hypothetical protein